MCSATWQCLGRLLRTAARGCTLWSMWAITTGILNREESCLRVRDGYKATRLWEWPRVARLVVREGDFLCVVQATLAAILRP